MDVDLLRLLLLIASRRSISAAAREHGISPSLAVRHLRRLEEWAGVVLFNRTTRKLEPTDAGRVFVEWAETTLSSLAATREKMDSLTGAVRGQVRVACPELLAFRFLPEMIERFAEDFPDVSVALHTTDAVLGLPDDAFDVGIHIGPRPTKAVVIRKLLGVSPILCASPSYLARHGSPEAPGDLSAHRLLRHTIYHHLDWVFDHNGKRISQAVSAHFETTNTILLYELALQGVGIARLTRRLADQDIAEGRLVEIMPNYRCVSTVSEPSSIWLILPHSRVPKRSRAFADSLVRYLRTVR